MLNEICIYGRITAEPELRKTKNDTSVCQITIACERDFATDGEKEVDFFDVVCWRSSADFVAKYFSKGQPILVKGRLSTRFWEDKDGNNRKQTEIIADSVYFAGSAPGKEEQKPSKNSYKRR